MTSYSAQESACFILQCGVLNIKSYNLPINVKSIAMG